MKFTILLVCCISVAMCFKLPGVQPVDYGQGDKVFIFFIFLYYSYKNRLKYSLIN